MIVLFHCHLHPNTRYVIGILGARSLAGANLEKPVVITFSTGPSLPFGRIEGTVSVPSGSPEGTLVGLFTTLFSDESPAALGVADASGHYVIPSVPPGTYWPAAIKDGNGSGHFDPEPGIDPVDLYDKDADGFADTLTLSEGEIRTNIDLSLALMANLTTRARFSQIEAKAQAWAADEALLFVTSSKNLSLEGEAPYWIYLFHSQSLSHDFVILATAAFMATEWDKKPNFTTPIPPNWTNSDVAVASAGAHGATFRSTHPEARMQAFLGVFSFDSDEGASQKSMKSSPIPWVRKRESFGRSNDLSKWAAMTIQETPVWTVCYTTGEEGDFLFVFLDPVTAADMASFPPPPTSARENVEAAGLAAKRWAQDAGLLRVIGNELVVPEGLSMFWSFRYRSASLDAARTVITGEGRVVRQEPFLHTFPLNEPLPQDWVDSPQVVALCESNGGAVYRGASPDVQVDAYLSKGLYAEAIHTAVWWIQYKSSSSPPLDFYIDAATGSFITDIEGHEKVDTLPNTCEVVQNHPNPFHPLTSISYLVKHSARVVPSVYDIQGRLVATLVDAFHAPGTYQVMMDGTPLTSGLSIYRLMSDGFEASKKMVLLR